LLALRTSAPLVSPEEAIEAADKIYGLKAQAFALAGERDRNFRLQAADGSVYVLKLIDPASTSASIDRQVGVLRYLNQEFPSLPVPRVFPTRAGAALGTVVHGRLTHSTLLISYLGGELLGARAPTAALLTEFGAMLARLDRALQGFFDPHSDPKRGEVLAWDLRRLPELSSFIEYLDSPGLRRRLGRISASLGDSLPALERLRAQTIHGDCHGSNVLVDAERRRVTGVVDFGDMIHGPLVIEIAVAMSELLTEGHACAADLPALLHSYTSVQRLQVAEVERLYDLVAARHAVTILVHAWRCQHDPAGAASLDAAARTAARSLEQLAEQGRDVLTRAWHDAAGTLPPSTPLTLRRRQHLGAGAELFYDQPLHLVRGEGAWLFDPAGRRYLDVYNNVPHVGHAHPAVIDAIERQVGLLNTHTRYLHEGVLDYAEQLVSRLPAHLNTCLFVNSGSEANDVAWRMAEFATGHSGGLVMAHAYHGITSAVTALTPSAGAPPDPRIETLMAPSATLTRHDAPGAAELAAVAADTDRAIAALHARGIKPAAFYLDSAFTSNGIFDPPEVWLAEMTQRIRSAGALIVGDEVQYGLGRSGSHFWGFERRGLLPDIVTLGKPVGNGFPLGVVIANRELVEKFQIRYGFFSTFGGNPVAAAAGLAVLETLDREQLMANAFATGRYLRDRLQELRVRHACLGQVRGAGLLLGLEVLDAHGAPSRGRARRFVNQLAERHSVLTGTEGPAGAVLKLRPPMVFGREHAEVLLKAIDALALAADEPL
jgi:4-aminobutyrate aminotransferase-like enzyme/aminoglycoside phosphotransferase (APT) family kinase protein